MNACITPGFSPANTSLPDGRNIDTRFWEVGEYSALYRSMVRFMAEVLDTEEMPFDCLAEPAQLRRNNGVLASAMGQCRSFMDLYDPGWWYTADLKLFFDGYREHPFGLVEPGMAAHAPFTERALVGEAYNDFIAFLRQQAVKRRVRKQLADWKAGILLQRQTIHEYLAELYSLYPWLLIVRIDHFYSEDAVDERDLLPRMSWRPYYTGRWSQVPSDAPSSSEPVGETRARIDTGLAMEHRNRFFRNQHGADGWLFDHMAGSIWKMEAGGQSSANHFHGLYLFDGSHWNLSDLPRLINGLIHRWSAVTGGLGQSYSCHDSPGRQQMIGKGTWVLGELDCKNPEHRQRLDTYVNYFAKTDFGKEDAQAIRIKPTPGANTLTMKQGPRR
ncbi:inovirus-type Gp2 protein [Paraburkholderia kururiensis]|uniref:inovirus-type Gp2 protein n=1 Tax=Paraburkholderia kururiensis TaxID=984307 RepID=UPI001F0BD9C8|nr:inovirus-type Gp2 protein [Paraburkholderia kururiensis]